MSLKEIINLCLEEGWSIKEEECEDKNWKDDGFFMVNIEGAR